MSEVSSGGFRKTRYLFPANESKIGLSLIWYFIFAHLKICCPFPVIEPNPAWHFISAWLGNWYVAFSASSILLLVGI